MFTKTREERFIQGKTTFKQGKASWNPGYALVYTDNKNFDQDKRINRRKDRWLCEGPSDVPGVCTQSFRQLSWFWELWGMKDTSPHPICFRKWLLVNDATYIEVLEVVMKPWIDSVRGERSYVFQQDSAPSHKAMTMQDWMSENLHDHITPNIWTPSSTDLNPLDYYVWGLFETSP